MSKYDPNVNRLLIERKQLTPEEDPLTDTQYLVRTGYLVLCGIAFLGPAGLFYVILQKVHQLMGNKPPIRE